MVHETVGLRERWAEGPSSMDRQTGGSYPQPPVGQKTLDVAELRAMFPELLLYGARWCRICFMDGSKSAEDLVQEAVKALLSGTCPDDVEVKAFLKMQIKQSATNHARHGKAFPKARVESLQKARAGADLEAAASMKELAEKTMAALVAMAARKEDTEVVAILSAYGQGHEKRVDVMKAASLSVDRFRAAKKRLLGYIERLPATVRLDIVGLLGTKS